MRTALLATIAAISLGVSVAHAGEGNGDPFPLNVANLPFVANPVGIQTGQAAYPAFAYGVQVPVTAGGMVPATSNQGIVESPSSLPGTPELGGVWPSTPLQPAFTRMS